MKEYLEWIVTYNSSFSNNHPILFKKLVDLHNAKVLTLVRQCDFFQDKETVNKMLDASYIEEVLTHKTLNEFDWSNRDLLCQKIIANPKLILTGVISIWHYTGTDEFTRVDAGKQEIEYLIACEERTPYFKGAKDGKIQIE